MDFVNPAALGSQAVCVAFTFHSFLSNHKFLLHLS